MIIACCGGIALYMTQTDTKNENYFGVQKLYEELKSKESYSFITTLDNNNKMYYAKQQNKAYYNIYYFVVHYCFLHFLNFSSSS